MNVLKSTANIEFRKLTYEINKSEIFFTLTK